MFTASDARKLVDNGWDEAIKQAINDRSLIDTAYLRVYHEARDGAEPFDERVEECKRQLEERGFSVTVEGIGSLRYADVVFSWKPDPTLRNVAQDLDKLFNQAWHPYDQEPIPVTRIQIYSIITEDGVVEFEGEPDDKGNLYAYHAGKAYRMTIRQRNRI